MRVTEQEHAKLMDIKALQRQIQHRYGVIFSIEQLTAFLESHPEIPVDDEEAGVVRALARDLEAGEWPLYGDGDYGMNSFWSRFVPKAIAAGYKIEPGAYVR